MKILVVLPNWLGDAVMATPALELLVKEYKDAKFTFIGSYVTIEALQYHPYCEKAIVDRTKNDSDGRLKATIEFAKSLGSFDIAITLRKQPHSSLLIKLVDAKLKIAKSSWHSKLLRIDKTPKIKTNKHLVIQYCELVFGGEKKFDVKEIPKLKLYIEPRKLPRKTLGINAGATYGSAKRWYPEKFAEVGASFANEFDILIFGGPNEVDVANDIEKELINLGVTNYTNIAGKTSIKELCEYIGGCSLFVTNDSGPMHIAAAYQIPTVAIFGPTKHLETSQWKNYKSIIVRDDIKCAPCMKRECPLKHHKCMKNITSQRVIEALKLLLN